MFGKKQTENNCSSCYLKDNLKQMQENHLCDIRAIDVLDFLYNGTCTGRVGADIYQEYCERNWEREKYIETLKRNIDGVYKLLDSATYVPDIKHRKEMTCGYNITGRQGATGKNVIKAVFAGRLADAFNEFIDCIEDYFKQELYDIAIKGWERRLTIDECFYLASLALVIAEGIRTNKKGKNYETS